MDHFEGNISPLVRWLGLHDGLVCTKSVLCQPAGIVLSIDPNGNAFLRLQSERLPVENYDAVVHLRSDQLSRALRMAAAGEVTFSLQDSVAVEGDVAWVLAMFNRLKTLPFAQAGLFQQWADVLPLPFVPAWFKVQLLNAPWRVSWMAIGWLVQALLSSAEQWRVHLIESKMAIVLSEKEKFNEQLNRLVDAVERLDVRMKRMESI
jgi:hypothetical protein